MKHQIERAYTEHNIASKHLEDELKNAATEAEAEVVEAKRAEQDKAFKTNILAIVEGTMDAIVPDVVTREETKKEQKRANQTMDDARSHLRGFARTIPMFLMAYGDRGIRLSNFDDYTPDDVFEEITGITEAEFRLLRDGQEVTEQNGTVTKIPGLLDEAVFDQSVQEFLDKKEALADYFDDAQTENIFAYIPQQKTSLVFTPQAVVKMMVDTLEAENPGIFTDPDKTVRRPVLHRRPIPDGTGAPARHGPCRRSSQTRTTAAAHPDLTGLRDEPQRDPAPHHHRGRLRRRPTAQGRGSKDSGHFRVGNLARMTPEERQKMVDDMLREGP